MRQVKGILPKYMKGLIQKGVKRWNLVDMMSLMEQLGMT